MRPPAPSPPDAPDAPDATPALARDLAAPGAPESQRLAVALARAFGPSALAVIHYGSHAQRQNAPRESARDFFVIVDRYGPAYRALARTVGTPFRPLTATLLAHVLAPNVIAVRVATSGGAALPKCVVLSRRDLRRLAGPRAPDHFVRARLFQHVQLLWTRDAAYRAEVEALVADVRRRTMDWVRPWLPPRFDAECYCRRLLEVSFRAEIRPERATRVEELLAAQRTTLVPLYAGLLDELARGGVLVREGAEYALASPVGRLDALRVSLYLRRSLVRATVRWLKYVALYEGWLDYIVRKLSRHGAPQEPLGPRERRWPLLFLWPKVIRFFRNRAR